MERHELPAMAAEADIAARVKEIRAQEHGPVEAFAREARA